MMRYLNGRRPEETPYGIWYFYISAAVRTEEAKKLANSVFTNLNFSLGFGFLNCLNFKYLKS